MDADQVLLERARALDEGALAEIFDEYYMPLYRYIYHHIGHVETAEDLTAEVFRRLLEQLHSGRGPRRLKPWLYRVAHNLVIDESRRFIHRDHQPLDERLLANATDVEEEAQQAILAERAHHALSHLTPKQRSVIILKFVEGMDNTEVARILALPVSAVKALQHRALAALRRNLSNPQAWAAEGETA